MKILVAIARACCLAAVLSSSGLAATWTVTTNQEAAAIDTNDCDGATRRCASLRGAINVAASGDTIQFDPALDGQTIALTLYSNDPGCVYVPPDPQNGITGGCFVRPNQGPEFGPTALFIDQRELTIDATANGLSKGVVLERNASAANFRLFQVTASAALELRGVTLHQGKARGFDGNAGGASMGAGGAVFNQGVLTAQRTSFVGNSAVGGNGLGGYHGPGAGVGSQQNPLDTNSPSYQGGSPNGSGGFGGGGRQGVTCNLIYLFITPPTKGGFGGGGGSEPTDGTCLPATGGFGGGGGGGDSSALGGFGGGRGRNAGGAGAGAGMGGAIFNDGGIVLLVNATFNGNEASGGVTNAGNGAINGSGLGAALFNYSGSLVLNAVTLSGNAANTAGGAIYSVSDGDCTTTASAQSGYNACPNGNAATLAIYSSIAAGNGAGADVVVDMIHGGAGSSANGGGNLIGGIDTLNGQVFGAGYLAQPASLSALSATLRGGLVDVMIPQFGNAAIDIGGNGSCPTTDQRGVPRPQGSACDAGAVEWRIADDRLFADGFQ